MWALLCCFIPYSTFRIYTNVEGIDKLDVTVVYSQTSTVEMDNWSTSGRAAVCGIADADVANSQQKLASLAAAAMTTGNAISMETTEATGFGGGRPRREHGEFNEFIAAV